jgi:hypothetical protein
MTYLEARTKFRAAASIAQDAKLVSLPILNDGELELELELDIDIMILKGALLPGYVVHAFFWNPWN